MEQSVKVSFSYHFERPLSAGCGGSLNEFDHTGEACWRTKSQKDFALKDPMMALIWRRWIAGIANIEK